MKGPDFIGVGAQKAGTTWLHKQLSKHPKVSFGRKEINFFNDRYSFYTKHPISNYKKGVRWYLEQLDIEEGKLNGDISPNYLWDEKAAKRIRKYFPDVKIIIMLRDPVKRAYSQFLHASKNFDVGDSLKEAVKKNEEILERGLYYTQLKRYYDLFPAENIKVLFFYDLKEKPEEMLKEVEDFLGLEKYVPETVRQKVNYARFPKYKFINRLNNKLVKVKNTRIGKRMWENPVIIRIKKAYCHTARKINLAEGSKGPIDRKTEKELRNYFWNDISKLERFLGKDLSFWYQ